MRFVNADGRAGLLVGEQVFDLEQISGGEMSSDPMTVITEQWDAAVAVHSRGAFAGGTPIFTKFRTSLTGPYDEVVLSKGKAMNDWEAELTFVTRPAGRYVSREATLDAVAGFTIAQDIFERATQFGGGGQFCMGKSFDTFCPLGPAIVTLDEIDDPGHLHVVGKVNGETKQDAYTDDLIFDVPALVEFISSICSLRAGDICLTGTPAGVGVVNGQFLQPGDVIDTGIEGLGVMRITCVAER